MKKLSLLITAIVIGIASTSFGQSSDIATSTATLVTPLSIFKTADLNFATLASSATDGRAEIDPETGNMSVFGGVTQIVGAIPVSDAAFTVTGEANETLTVSLKYATVTLTGTGDDLDITLFEYSVDRIGNFDFTTNPSIIIPVVGSFSLTVGGTLTILAGQEAGTYSNLNDLEVTVNYQ